MKHRNQRLHDACSTRIRSFATVGWTAATIVLATCGGADSGNEGEDGTLSTTVDTVAGVVHVLNTGAAPEWTLTPVASIGPSSILGSDSPAEFGQAVSVALDPAGQAVYVLDQLSCEIKVFGADGTHLRTFGRCGEGPSEFTSFFYSIAWAGDRLLSLDMGAGRIGELSPDGEWLGQRRTFTAMGGSSETRFYSVGANEVYAAELTRAGASGGRLGRMWVGHAAEGETGDTIAFLPPTGARGITCEWGEGMLGFYEVPYGSRRLQHPGPGGVLYTAVTDEYKIVQTRGDDTLRVIERSLSAEDVTDAEWGAVEEEWNAWLEERPGASCDPRGPARPVAKPFLTDVFVAPDGRLFVEVVRDGGNYWEAFDSSGALVGRVQAPSRRAGRGTPSLVPPAFGGGLVAAVRRDSLDLDHVDVFSLEERP